MPFLTVGEDGARLYYEVHGPGGPVGDGGIDIRLPVVLLLAPTSLDSSFLVASQANDAKLKQQCTFVAVDDRSSGRSSASYNAAVDTWVHAADLAKLICHLSLPPVHIFTSQAGATRQAVRLAVLWPDMVRSLALAGIIVDMLHTPTPRNFFYDTFNAWATARKDVERDTAINQWISSFIGDPEDKLAPSELRHSLFAYLKQRYPPDRPEDLAKSLQVVFHRHPVPRERVLDLKKPTIIFWGSENAVCPVMVAIGMSHRYTNAKGEAAKMVVVNGAPNLLCLTHAETVNAHLSTFVAKNHDPDQGRKRIETAREHDKRFWEAALKRFADIVDEPELGIAHRDPLDSISFSALTSDKAAELIAMKNRWVKAQQASEAKSSSRPTVAA